MKNLLYNTVLAAMQVLKPPKKEILERAVRSTVQFSAHCHLQTYLIWEQPHTGICAVQLKQCLTFTEVTFRCKKHERFNDLFGGPLACYTNTTLAKRSMHVAAKLSEIGAALELPALLSVASASSSAFAALSSTTLVRRWLLTASQTLL